MEIKNTVEVTTKLTINGDDMLELLKKAEIIPPDAGCSVQFKVPSGGDWSGLLVYVNNENPITITYTEQHDGNENL